MTRLISSFFNLLLFSRREHSVRKTVVFLVSNFLLIAAVIFTLEVLVIALGARDVILPLPFRAIALLRTVLL